VSADATDRRHEWLPWTLPIRDLFVDRHPHHDAAVQAALDLIARDPHGLELRRYRGHDAGGEAYVYPVPDTGAEIVFCLIDGVPGQLGLFQILDWEDLSGTG
jgi:hypothetical protein